VWGICVLSQKNRQCRPDVQFPKRCSAPATPVLRHASGNCGGDNTRLCEKLLPRNNPDFLPVFWIASRAGFAARDALALALSSQSAAIPAHPLQGETASALANSSLEALAACAPRAERGVEGCLPEGRQGKTR
jgi:hypothetical protein